MPVTLADLQIVQYDRDVHDVSKFDSDDTDINEFLQRDAWKYQADHISHTRLAYLDQRLVGYITLLADCVILLTSEKKKALKEAKEQHQTVYTFPAVKIGRIGVQKDCQGLDIGTQLLKYAVGVVVRMNRELNVGCRLITLDAYPKSVGFYEKRGFMYNKHYRKRVQETNAFSKCFNRFFGGPSKKLHPSMRYDILKSPEIV
jgi:GNAT superfamily N-acetyltransferase